MKRRAPTTPYRRRLLLSWLRNNRDNPRRSHPGAEWWTSTEMWELMRGSYDADRIYPDEAHFGEAMQSDLNGLEWDKLVEGVHRGAGTRIKYRITTTQEDHDDGSRLGNRSDQLPDIQARMADLGQGSPGSI